MEQIVRRNRFIKFRLILCGWIIPNIGLWGYTMDRSVAKPFAHVSIGVLNRLVLDKMQLVGSHLKVDQNLFQLEKRFKFHSFTVAW